MTTEQIAKIFNEGVSKGVRDTEKHEFYLKQFNDKYYIIVFIKNRNGDKLCGCFTEDNFLGNVELLKKAFFEMFD